MAGSRDKHDWPRRRTPEGESMKLIELSKAVEAVSSLVMVMDQHRAGAVFLIVLLCLALAGVWIWRH